jgi:hypothetical protein
MLDLCVQRRKPSIASRTVPWRFRFVGMRSGVVSSSIDVRLAVELCSRNVNRIKRPGRTANKILRSIQAKHPTKCQPSRFAYGNLSDDTINESRLQCLSIVGHIAIEGTGRPRIRVNGDNGSGLRSTIAMALCAEELHNP